MSINTLILRNPNVGEAQVSPESYPRTFEVVFEGSGRVLVGTDGRQPTEPVPAGRPVPVVVNVNSMHISWEVDPNSKLEWRPV